MRFVALLSVALLFAPSHLVSQQLAQSDSAAPIVQYRNPAVARALSIVPGLGYLYTGEYLRGYGTGLLSIGGPAFGVFFVASPCGILVSECSSGHKLTSQGVGLLMIAASVWTYASSIHDAARSAERANARHAGKMRLTPVFSAPASSGALNAGVSVSW